MPVGDARYGGFDNQQLSAYLGIPVNQVQMLQELMQNQATPADIALAQQLAGQGGGGPMGGANKLENIQLGLEHLQAHPLGSKHHGFNPTDLIANIATGGLYGLGKAAYGGLTGKENLFDAAKGGLNQLGPWGAATYDIPGYGPQIAQTGNLIGAGAGLGGGGFGAFKPTGFGGVGAESGFAGAGVADLGPGAMIDVDAMGNPIYQGATAAGKGGMTAEQMGAAGFPSMTMGGGAGAAGGGSPFGGASFGQGLGQMFGGAPGAGGMPMPGQPMPGATGAQALTPQQRASLGAQQSEAHKGLAPRWEARMKGGREQPGLASAEDLSMAALYGLGGGQ